MTTYNEITTDYQGGYAGTTLLQYRQTAAKQIGTWLQGTLTSATSSTVVCTTWPLISSVTSNDTWEDKYLLVPSASVTDRVRIVSAYDASTGTVTVDKAFGSTPSTVAFELHGGPLEPWTEMNDVINTVLKRLMVEAKISFTPTIDTRRVDVTNLFNWIRDPRWVRQAGYLASGETLATIDPFAQHPVRGIVYKEADTIYLDWGARRWLGTETIYLKVIKPAYYLCRASGGSFGEQGGLAADTDECLVDPMWVASGVLVEAYDRYARILEGAAAQSLIRNRAEAVAWFDLLTRQNYVEPDDMLEPGEWWGPLPVGIRRW